MYVLSKNLIYKGTKRFMEFFLAETLHAIIGTNYGSKQPIL